MATPEEIKREQELLGLLNDRLGASSSILDSLKEQLGIQSKRTSFEDQLLGINKKISNAIASQREELTDIKDLTNQITKNEKLIEQSVKVQQSLAGSINKERKEGADKTLRTINALKTQQNIYADLLKQAEEQGGVTDAELERQKSIIANIEAQLDKRFEGLSSLEREYVLNEQNRGLLEEQNLEREKQLDIANAIQDSLGLSGGFLKALGAIPGLGKPAADAFAEVEKAIQESATELDEVPSRLQTMGMLAKSFGKNLLKAVTDPAAIFGSILKTALEYNKEAVKTSQLTGQTSQSLRGQLSTYASTLQVVKQINQLTEATGLAAQNIFTPANLGAAAQFQKTLGLSAEQAGNLAKFSQATGTDLKENTKALVETVSNFNAANNSAVAHGVVLRDVANTSDDIAASLGGNPQKIAEAAAQARNLGLSLKEVDAIASSLLDFESSISAELEAEVLLGKDLNLEKARQAALNNDLAAVGKEIFSNAASVAEFGRMNRIQQEAQAKALGLNRDQLAKIAFQQGIVNGLTEEQAAKAANVKLSDMERIAAAENFQQAVEKITGALAPLLNIVGNILSMPLAPYLIGATALIFKFSKGLGGLGRTGATAGRGVRSTLRGVGQGMRSFAMSMSTPTPLGPVGIAGPLILGALSLAAMGFGKALAFASPAIEAFGNAFKSVFEGLGTVVEKISEGFNNFIGQITLEKAAAMYAMVPAVLALSGSFATLGASLMGVALGGALALPVLSALDGFNLLGSEEKETQQITTQSSDESKEKETQQITTQSSDEVVSTLNEIKEVLNQILNKNVDVYLDSDKVGTSFNVNTVSVQ